MPQLKKRKHVVKLSEPWDNEYSAEIPCLLEHTALK